MSTSYKNDYVITVQVVGDRNHDSHDFEEGYTKKELNKFTGNTPVEKILAMYEEWNIGKRECDKRIVLGIKRIKRKVLYDPVDAFDNLPPNPDTIEA